MKSKSIALITGATSGIGKATAIELAKKNFTLILTGRRKDRLKIIKSELEAQYKIEVLITVFDVSKENEVKKALSKIESNYPKIDVLVNNAGLALGLTTIDNGETSDWETMIDVNIKGLLFMTKYTIPILKKSSNPLIINIGSIAGKETYPKGNVYCATKHAVDSLTKAMRIDLLPLGIKVSQVCPGATETEFSLVRYKGDKKQADSVYDGFKSLKPEDIANVIGFIVDLPEHVNINDILVMPKQQATSGIIFKKH